MKKIVLLPLDERPCNQDFPRRLFAHGDLTICQPSELGQYKKPADFNKLKAFLLEACRDADALIISLDMLIYGGLIPSRLHHERLDSLRQRLALLHDLRTENPDMLIYGFQCILRCPDYNSDEEEPDYYETAGQAIHALGVAVHRSRLGEKSIRQIARLRAEIGQEALNDYIQRRDLNRTLNLETLKYLEDHTLDALVIPRDDSQEFGYPAMDEELIRQEIYTLDMTDRVLIYPGADEVELTLLARIINQLHSRKPKVYVKYACDKSRELIPLYEGCSLETTIKYHIMSAGFQSTSSYEQADIVLVITAPSASMQEAAFQPASSAAYTVDRLLAELIEFIRNRLEEGKVVTIGDDAYANGGDLDFLHLLNKADLLMKIDGYAGWNTNANTLGTALAEACDSFYYGKTAQHQDFLLQRYLEDGGYCAKVRQTVSEAFKIRPAEHFIQSDREAVVCDRIKVSLQQFLTQALSSIATVSSINHVSLPWHRMFEINLEATHHATAGSADLSARTEAARTEAAHSEVAASAKG
ncbi:DUF4127 family protein [Oscillospiraceae bacterium HV4-5-C5C]|nr:DUF4127 family protein [Oscillospiraceae bacterium HV4-5-C5C]